MDSPGRPTVITRVLKNGRRRRLEKRVRGRHSYGLLIQRDARDWKMEEGGL